MAKIYSPKFSETGAKSYKSKKTPKKRYSPKFNPKNAKVFEKGENFIEDDSFTGQAVDMAIDTMDVPSSVLRAGVGGALDPDKSALSEMGGQISDIATKGPDQTVNAPTGEELLEQAGFFEGEDSIGKTVAGIGAEVALDPLSIVNPLKSVGKLASKGLRKAGKNLLSTKTAKALSHIQSITKGNLAEGFDPQVISRRMIEEDLVKYMGNPTKLKERLEGTRSINETGNKWGMKIKRGKREGGLIADASDSLRDIIRQASGDMSPVHGRTIRDKVIRDFEEVAEDITQASGLTGSDLSKVREISEAYLPGGSYSVEELFKAKKALSKQLNSKTYFQTADKALSLEKDVMMKIERAIDSELKPMLSGFDVNGVDASDAYETINNQVHQYLNLKNFLGMEEIKALKGADLPTLAASATVKGLSWAVPSFALETMSGQGGVGLAGMAAGMGVDAGATASKAVRHHSPIFQATTLDKAMNLPETGAKIAPEAGRMLRDEEERREDPAVNPNSSMMAPQDRLDMNVSKKLQQTKVPRDSKAITQNPNILKYKIAQNAESIVSRKMAMAGLDPESMPDEVSSAAESLYKNAEMLLTEMPDEIPAILPVWVQTMPELFEKDRLNRIDGVVPNSMRADASKEIEKSGKYGTKKSTHDMIAELDELHSTGRYLG